MPRFFSRLKPFALWYGLSALGLALAIAPVIKLRPFRTPLFHSPFAVWTVKCILLLLPFLAAWWVVRKAAVSLTERRVAWTICLGLTLLCEVVHYWVTDLGHSFPPEMVADNTVWQKNVHEAVLRLRTDHIPHSYRFLPNALLAEVRWLAGGDFEFGRLAFRLIANAVLFAMFYRLGRIYLQTGLAAVAVVVTMALIYPISVLRYAGQPTDPISHLSFVLCFYCLARRHEPGFGPSLVVGVFAKESVAVMALCRAFYGPTRLRAWVAAALYGAAALIAIIAIRLVVNSGTFAYERVSGVGSEHVLNNLRMYREWIPMFLVTFGLLAPGAILGWKYMDRPFRATTIVITLSVILSSLVFSWLVEVRNNVPAFLPLAIATMKYLEVRLTPHSTSAAAACGDSLSAP